MKSFRYDLCCFDAQIASKDAIQCPGHPPEIKITTSDIKMHHLPGRMHAGIGAAAENYGHLLAKELAESLSQLTLNCPNANLRLAAVKFLTRILN